MRLYSQSFAESMQDMPPEDRDVLWFRWVNQSARGAACVTPMVDSLALDNADLSTLSIYARNCATAAAEGKPYTAYEKHNALAMLGLSCRDILEFWPVENFAGKAIQR